MFQVLSEDCFFSFLIRTRCFLVFDAMSSRRPATFHPIWGLRPNLLLRASLGLFGKYRADLSSNRANFGQLPSTSANVRTHTICQARAQRSPDSGANFRRTLRALVEIGPKLAKVGSYRPELWPKRFIFSGDASSFGVFVETVRDMLGPQRCLEVYRRCGSSTSAEPQRVATYCYRLSLTSGVGQNVCPTTAILGRRLVAGALAGAALGVAELAADRYITMWRLRRSLHGLPVVVSWARAWVLGTQALAARLIVVSGQRCAASGGCQIFIRLVSLGPCQKTSYRSS